MNWTDYRGGTEQCNAIRPGTLGYQFCQFPDEHDGAHKSQDGKLWPLELPSAIGQVWAAAQVSKTAEFNPQVGGDSDHAGD